ncbi:DUF7426 family protein [Rhodococcus qingshengii]|uniref:DUF7426 family protein n=1 Tax=Rhodococcus qingshengii TaxID=334542 RepID=UPI0010A60B11|nr:hypothetical protein [Rhodococcus qingshengii]THJ69988.1 hypothetical protein EU244_20225 [Rhodococcus qingshengii]
MRDLAETWDPDLILPIGGYEFRVSCTARQGMHLVHLLDEKPRLTDTQEREEILYILGDTYQQMVDVGISWPKIAVAGRVAMAFFGMGPEAGRIVWETAGGVLAGNPLPPSPKQTRVGANLSRKIFQRPGHTDRTILAAARS